MLVIERYLPPNTDVESFEFTTLSDLIRGMDHPDKGFKKRVFWKTNNDEKLAIEMLQSIVNYNDSKALKRVFNWYDENGEIKLKKEKIHRIYNGAGFKTFEKKVRGQAIDYLEYQAEKKGQGFLIKIITHTFKTELDHFILSGTDEFKDALEAELTNPSSQVIDLGDGNTATLGQILGSKLPPTDLHPEGQTVLEGILAEIM